MPSEGDNVMNKMFKKLCGTMDYKTYKNIESILFSLGGTAGIGNIIMTLGGNGTSDLLSLISSFSYFSYVYFGYSSGECYTKEINEIRKLYQEFICNYNKMNKDFGFNEPISIYAMYHYMYTNGYLSYDKSFEFLNKECNNIRLLLGADVICGRAVCRHITSMLTDILNDNGIKSLNVSCYTPSLGLEVVPVSFEEYSRERNISLICKYIPSTEERRETVNNILFLESEGVYLNVCLKRLDEKKDDGGTSNHAITYSYYDDMSYYLDPTQFRMYRLQENSKCNLYDEFGDDVVISYDHIRRLNDRSNKKVYGIRNKAFKYSDSVSLEEEREILEFVRKICLDNKDVFESFYRNNHDLYGEIVNKTSIFNKKLRK